MLSPSSSPSPSPSSSRSFPSFPSSSGESCSITLSSLSLDDDSYPPVTIDGRIPAVIDICRCGDIRGRIVPECTRRRGVEFDEPPPPPCGDRLTDGSRARPPTAVVVPDDDPSEGDGSSSSAIGMAAAACSPRSGDSKALLLPLVVHFLRRPAEAVDAPRAKGDDTPTTAVLPLRGRVDGADDTPPRTPAGDVVALRDMLRERDASTAPLTLLKRRAGLLPPVLACGDVAARRRSVMPSGWRGDRPCAECRWWRAAPDADAGPGGGGDAIIVGARVGSVMAAAWAMRAGEGRRWERRWESWWWW